jgi:hypothetical protein
MSFGQRKFTPYFHVLECHVLKASTTPLCVDCVEKCVRRGEVWMGWREEKERRKGKRNVHAEGFENADKQLEFELILLAGSKGSGIKLRNL